MANVGTLIATLGLDAGDFKRGLSSASGDLDSFGGRAVKGGAMVGTALAGVGAAAAAGIGVAINIAADFEQQIDQVGAVAQATEPQMAALGETALRIGSDTAFSAREAAGAMEILAANGLTVEQILGGAADATATLAAAGGTDLATAANVASTALGVWGLEASELTEVVNRMAGAANVSKFGVEDMAQAMAQGGGIAAAAGISMADFATTIATGAKYFASGADAGTSFKTFIQRLANPVGKAGDLMAELGINVFDAQGNMKSMEEIAGILQGSLSGLTEAQRAEALATIFGSDASRTAIGLMEQGAEGFKEMSDVMRDTDASAVAAARMDNLNGAIEQLKGAFETIAIRIGARFIPVLTDVVSVIADKLPGAFEAGEEAVSRFVVALTPFVTAVASVLGPAIETVLPYIQQFVAAFVDNEEAMQTAGIVLGTILVGAFVALTVAAGSAAVAVIAAMLPFIAITTAVGLLVAGVVLLIQNWDAIVEKFPAAGVALEGVKAIWEAVTTWITSVFIPRVMEMAEALSAAGQAAIQFVTDHWSQISAIIDAALALILTQVEIVWNLISGVIEGAMQIITGIINVVLGVLTGDWERAWEGIKDILEGVWKIIESVVQYAIDTTKNLITNGLELIRAQWALVWDVIQGKLEGAWENIKSATSGAIDTIKGWIESGWNTIRDLTATAFNAIWERIKSAMSDIVDSIRAKGEEAIQWFRDLPGMVLGAIGDVASLLWQKGRDMVQGFIDGIQSLAGSVRDAASGLGGIAQGALGAFGFSPWPSTIGYGHDFGDGFIQGMEESESSVAATAESLAHSAIDAAYESSLEGIASAYSLGDAYGRVREMARAAGMESAVWEMPIDKLRELLPMAEEYAEIVGAVAEQGGRIVGQGLIDGIASTTGDVEAIARELGFTGAEALRVAINAQEDDVRLAASGLAEQYAAGIDSEEAVLRGAFKAFADAGYEVFEDASIGGMTRVMSTTDKLLMEYRDRMHLGLETGASMGLLDIQAMLADFESAIDTNPLPQRTADWARRMLDSFRDSFAAGAGIANADVVRFINELMQAIDAAEQAAASGAQRVAAHVTEIQQQVSAAQAAGVALTNSAPTGGGIPEGYWLDPQGRLAKIPSYATGTGYHPGGLAMVGERGPELVSLPRGAQVLPNDMFRDIGGGVQVENSGPITIYANDPADALAELNDWSYKMAAAARGRGLE